MNFALVAMPRSGTSWASVWLMDGALCYHDPLATMSPEELLAFRPGKRWGISCTASWLLDGFLEAAGCPVVVIDNDLEEVQRSLLEMGAPALTRGAVEMFDRLTFPRFQMDDLFDEDGAREIWTILRPDMPMDVERWKLLSQLKIQPDFYKWKPDPKIMREALERFMGGV